MKKIMMVLGLLLMSVNIYAAGTVESNYYEKEMAFNGKLQATANANALTQKIAIDKKEGQVVLTIDSTITSAITNAEIHFYNPASEKSDKKWPLAASGNGKYIFHLLS